MARTYVPHVLLSMSGVLGSPSGSEIWNCNIRWRPLGGLPTEAQLQAAADALRAPLRDWCVSSDSFISQAADLRTVKLNVVQANGKQREQNTVLSDLESPAGGATPRTAPYYQTFALTFRTRLRRGRGHAGRIYPPIVAPVIQQDGYVAVGDATRMATAGALMLENCRTAMALAFGGPVPDPVVISVGSDTAPVVAPGFTPIIGVVVDRVPDVQHRRTNNLPRSEGQTVLLDA